MIFQFLVPELPIMFKAKIIITKRFLYQKFSQKQMLQVFKNDDIE